MTPSDTYSALLSMTFDWGVGAVSGKISRQQEAFKYSTQYLAKVNNVESSYPFDVIDTRLKVQGTGKVSILRYESQEGKDFELLGHVTPFTTETEG
ncbi:MAG: hypothetical protein V3S69_05275 [Dehalococcoidales bacterium]